jgi:Na+/proline symporter
MANAFFVGLAVFGTDQELVQRLLTVRTRRSSQQAIVGTIVAVLPMLAIYLSLGTLLFVFYQQHPQLPQPQEYKYVYSNFVATALPAGLRGLVLAAVVLASIDSPLSSLSASFVTDIYRPLLNKSASERHYLLVSRAGVAGFGVVLALIALACQPIQDVLWFAFEIISVTGGSILGVFLLGVLTPWGGYRHNVAAMVLAALGMGTLLVLSHAGLLALAWSWLIVIGTATTFLLGLLLGPVMNRKSTPRGTQGR